MCRTLPKETTICSRLTTGFPFNKYYLYGSWNDSKHGDNFMQNKTGLIQIYTGNGKGKTTAAFGQALRLIGHGGKVCVIQFMKGRKYGECLAAEKHLAGKLDIHLSGLDSFVMRDNPALVDIELAQGGLKLAQEVITLKNYDMLILDEINIAIDFNLVELSDVVNIVNNKPTDMDMILTGRYAPPELLVLADTVTEIQEVRHHYQTGIKEKAGMEF